jgi:hypothetical protein
MMPGTERRVGKATKVLGATASLSTFLENRFGKYYA